MNTSLSNIVMKSQHRLAMPIGVYAGLEITGATVYQAVTDASVQADAVLALKDRFNSSFLLTAMDLSAEAEVFGCDIRMSDDEIPTVIGRKITSAAQVRSLFVPHPGDLRTSVHLNAASKLVSRSDGTPVLGGMIGPFSLAGRLFGVSEALELTLSEPDTMIRLLEKTSNFLTNYAIAFRQLGAQGVIMAEPAAGLLSPRGLARFSSMFIKQIVDAVQTPNFTIVLHNCGAKLIHLPKILESGAEICHFGAPMDIVEALKQVDGSVIICGNLDPTAVFYNGTVDDVKRNTKNLLNLTAGYQNYVISSGCDLPPGVPLVNLIAFYETVGGYI